MARKKSTDPLLTGEVRAKIRSMILGSEFKPGQRLVEDELSETLKIGRTPVREALLLLQGEGFIERQRGWVVHEVDRSKVHEIFESRAVIEGSVARLAARRISKDMCARLDALVVQMEPGANMRRQELNRLNREFHGLIVDAAANSLLATFHERTQFYYWMLRIPVMFSDEQLTSTNQQHRQIVKALRRGDEDAADKAAREHVEATMRIVEPALLT
jgi:DNA-binding GntR family transcriptional regulator